MREERIPIIEVRRTYRTGEVRIVDGDTVICREDTYNFRRPKDPRDDEASMGMLKAVNTYLATGEVSSTSSTCTLL